MTRVNRERRKPSVTPRCLKKAWGSARAAFEILRILQNFTPRKSHGFSTESKHDIEICNPQDCGKATRHGNKELLTMACRPSSSKHAERKLFHHRMCILRCLFYTRQLSWVLPFARLVEGAFRARTLTRKATWQRIFWYAMKMTKSLQSPSAWANPIRASMNSELRSLLKQHCPFSLSRE